MKKTCDVCGFIDESSLGVVVHECKDGLYRCKLCRQKAVYGHAFFYDGDEYEAHKRGEGNMRFDIK